VRRVYGPSLRDGVPASKKEVGKVNRERNRQAALHPTNMRGGVMDGGSGLGRHGRPASTSEGKAISAFQSAKQGLGL